MYGLERGAKTGVNCIMTSDTWSLLVEYRVLSIKRYQMKCFQMCYICHNAFVNEIIESYISSVVS